MRFLDSGTIEMLDKKLTLLDKFVIRFCRILSKHVKYVIVSGYVAILFGRARSTEDIDILIDDISEEQARLLYSDLRRHGYYFLNAKTFKTMFALLSEGLRVSRERRIIPNFELKVAKGTVEREVLDKSLNVIFKGGELKISGIEVQIAYKEKRLGTPQDLEDARHLRRVFINFLDLKALRDYRKRLER